MFNTYLMYEVERPRTMAERRDEEVRRGEFARALSRVLHRRGQVSQVASAVVAVSSERPALTLITGTGESPALPAGVPAQRDNRTAC